MGTISGTRTMQTMHLVTSSALSEPRTHADFDSSEGVWTPRVRGEPVKRELCAQIDHLIRHSQPPGCARPSRRAPSCPDRDEDA